MSLITERRQAAVSGVQADQERAPAAGRRGLCSRSTSAPHATGLTACDHLGRRRRLATSRSASSGLLSYAVDSKMRIDRATTRSIPHRGDAIGGGVLGWNRTVRQDQELRMTAAGAGRETTVIEQPQAGRMDWSADPPRFQ